MLYHKFSLGDGRVMKADLHEDEIFTDCPSCGFEQQVDKRLLKYILDNGDFGGTKTYCVKCTKKRKSGVI